MNRRARAKTALLETPSALKVYGDVLAIIPRDSEALVNRAALLMSTEPNRRGLTATLEASLTSQASPQHSRDVITLILIMIGGHLPPRG